jgi:hypothetical protein
LATAKQIDAIPLLVFQTFSRSGRIAASELSRLSWRIAKAVETVRTRLKPRRFTALLRLATGVPFGFMAAEFAICMNRALSTGSDEMISTTSLIVVSSRTRATCSRRTTCGNAGRSSSGLRFAASC